jgi:hypothetical protein
MATSSGFSLLSLVGGLLDSTSTDQLSAVLREIIDFAKEDHRFVVTIHTHVDPKREDD